MFQKESRRDSKIHLMMPIKLFELDWGSEREWEREVGVTEEDNGWQMVGTRQKYREKGKGGRRRGQRDEAAESHQNGKGEIPRDGGGKEDTVQSEREREKTKRDDKSKERESLRASAARPASLLYLQCSWGQGLSGSATRCYIVILVIDHHFVALWLRCFVWALRSYWHLCVFLCITTLSVSPPPSLCVPLMCCPVVHSLSPLSHPQRSISSIRSRFADCCIIYPYRGRGAALLKAQLTPSVSLAPLISPWWFPLICVCVWERKKSF